MATNWSGAPEKQVEKTNEYRQSYLEKFFVCSQNIAASSIWCSYAISLKIVYFKFYVHFAFPSNISNRYARKSWSKRHQRKNAELPVCVCVHKINIFLLACLLVYYYIYRSSFSCTRIKIITKCKTKLNRLYKVKRKHKKAVKSLWKNILKKIRFFLSEKGILF